MKNIIILTLIIILASITAFGQNKKIDHPTLAIYKILSEENINVKDSLAIYALNFELSISKKDNGSVITNIIVNDSLAFKLFPSYKKFYDINFRSLIGTKNKIKLIIPILIYGSSPEKMIYKDKYGNPLISFNAAVNAAYALYSPLKYNNQKDANTQLGHLIYKASQNSIQQIDYRDVILMTPITIEINNIR